MPINTLNSQLTLSITPRSMFAAIIWIATYRYIGSIWKATPIAFFLYKAVRYRDASFVTMLTIWYFVYPYVQGIPETAVVTFILYKLVKRAFCAVRMGELWFRVRSSLLTTEPVIVESVDIDRRTCSIDGRPTSTESFACLVYQSFSTKS